MEKEVEIVEVEMTEVEEMTRFEKVKDSAKKHWKKIAIGAGIGLAFVVGAALKNKSNDEDCDDCDSEDDDDDSYDDDQSSDTASSESDGN